ncbi:hypothetical protein GUJ93_ZPchr0002g26239 [Zizania palustris]|uniref:Uncharacterized protein n=1 Tax=Zizania palustris TaxID=103762 RepID=A0A8J5VT92_ZIZPA|nr:hypothetical protein GUJ93_ZPchr0002g26239 [Zizania palustris]
MKTCQIVALFVAFALVVLAAEASSDVTLPSVGGCRKTTELPRVTCQWCFTECIRAHSDGVGLCTNGKCICAYECDYWPPKAAPAPSRLR